MNSVDDLFDAIYQLVTSGNLVRAERELLEYSGSDVVIRSWVKRWGKDDLSVRVDFAKMWNNIALRYMDQAVACVNNGNTSGCRPAIDAAERCCRNALKPIIGDPDKPEGALFLPSYVDRSVLIRSLYVLGYVALVLERTSFAARCLQTCYRLPPPQFSDPKAAEFQREASAICQSLGPN